MDIRGKEILDACCGGMMFYFDKDHDKLLTMDRRQGKEDLSRFGRSNLMIEPDIIGDFKDLPFPDESFYHIVFDPPHLIHGGDNSYMIQKYGKLNKDSWKEDISKGFKECFRVLKHHGTMVFKWSEYQIKINEVLKCFDKKPLYGNKNGSGHTYWFVFYKE